MDAKEIQERFTKIDKAFEEATAKLAEALKGMQPKQEAKANFGCAETCAPAPVCHADLAYLSDRIGYLRDELSYFRETFYRHLEGHLPKIVGATAMTKALKAIGLDGDYKVEKQTIYANDGKATAEEFLISRKLNA